MWLSIDVSAFRHPGNQRARKPCPRDARNPNTRCSGEEKYQKNLDRPLEETRGERSEFWEKSRNPVDCWIHTHKSRRSLTQISITKFGDLNDKESWSHCISNSRVSKPRKDPYRRIRGGLQPLISLWRETWETS
jgi:hypothetical protein